MEKIIEFIVNFWQSLKEMLGFILDGFLSVFLAVFQLILEGFLSLVYLFVSTLDVGSFVFNASAAWSGLDPKITWMVNAVGLPTCLTILGGAYIIRFIMNLIPAAFTRV